MTPMVDIAFLLLIFYMTTTQFKPLEARPVDLPASHSQIELPERDVITVTITRLDSVFVDWVQRTLVEIDGHRAYSMVRFVRPADRYTVASWINKARGNNDRALVVFKADRDASFGITQDIIRAMQMKNVRRFLIITEPESDGRYITRIIE
jgi:biopolymer transport protein ExbD